MSGTTTRRRFPTASASALAAAALLFAAGCATPTGTVLRLSDNPACRLDEAGFPAALAAAVANAQKWLRVEPFLSRRVYDEPGASPPRVLKRKNGRTYLSVRSYPDHPDAGLRGRTFLYDQALTLLWFSWSGDAARADGLADALALLQNADGSWGFSFNGREGTTGYYNAAYVRHGAVAWTAYALAWHGRVHARPRFVAAAQRATEYLAAARVRDDLDGRNGLLPGGRGRWSADGRRFFPGETMDAAALEHQIDAHQAFVLVDPPRAQALEGAILGRLWMEPEGRFAVAAQAQGRDAGRALDAAGAWGALWLEGAGHPDLARRSLQYAHEHFARTVDELDGWIPYLDPIEGPLTNEDRELLFVEGGLGLGLAAARLERPDLARLALRSAVELACLGGPGAPYANREHRQFTTAPGAASTVWLLFLAEELRSGRRAPPFDPASAARESEHAS